MLLYFCFCLEVGAPLMRAGGGGVPRTLPLPMEGVKLLRDGPLAKAAFFCCDFVKFCLTFPQKMTNIYIIFPKILS